LVCSGLSAGFEKVGAIGGAHVGVVGRPESDGHHGYGSRGDRAGAWQRYEQVTSGGYGAWAKTAGVTKYQGYRGMAEDIVHSDQAMVNGCVGWTSQTGTIGCHEPNRRFEQATRNGGSADIDMARVAGSTAEVTRRTASVWADIKPTKLYSGVGQSDLDSGITGNATSVLQTTEPVAYTGQAPPPGVPMARTALNYTLI